MRPVSAIRSALMSALAGTAIVALVFVGAMLVSAQGHEAWSGTVRIGDHTTGWSVPLLQALLVVGPLALLTTFGTFFLIGRRAARPLEVAKRQQLQFTADASHELRTPLTVIQGESSLALGRPREAAEYREALEKVAAESRHMRRLVDDLLWLGRSESDPDRPDPVAVHLDDLVRDAVARFQAVAAAKGQQLSAAMAGGRPMLQAPDGWMERLAGVLLENACRYTPTGGVIRIGAAATREGVSLVVEDSGPGIPLEEGERIFDRFHRSTPVAGGSGLGLAIAARVVAETGGTWNVGRSELGGTRMEVTWRRREARGRRRLGVFRELSRSGP